MIRRLFLVFILISTFAVAGCKISGIITTSDGVGVEGVTVILDCDDSVQDCDASMSTTTDADGTFVFHKIKPGNYKVKPADDKHTFEPASKNVNVGYKKMARADFEIVTSPAPPSPVSLPPWSTYQGNAAHTGYVPVILSTDNFDEGRTYNITGSVSLNPVAAGDGKIFVTTGGDYGPYVAMALDSSDGRTLWTYNFGNIDFISPPAYANGTVYIQSGVGMDSYLWAFDAEESNPKKEVFQTPYDNQSFRYYAPTIYDDYVYIGGGELEGGFGGGVYEFDGILGGRLWYVYLGALNTSDQWTPAVNENYVITYNGLYRYDLYEDSKLTVINRLDGTVAFSIPDLNFEWDGTSMDLAPVLGSQNNVIAFHDGRLINFDLTNQSIGWEMPNEEGDAESFSGQPSLANGIIYAVSEGYLHALDEDGGSFIEEWKPWQPPSGESIVTPMIVTDNLIFVSTASMTYAVDLESQTAVWSYAAGGHLALSDDGVLYIATAEGILHAISTLK